MGNRQPVRAEVEGAADVPVAPVAPIDNARAVKDEIAAMQLELFNETVEKIQQMHLNIIHDIPLNSRSSQLVKYIYAYQYNKRNPANIGFDIALMEELCEILDTKYLTISDASVDLTSSTVRYSNWAHAAILSNKIKAFAFVMPSLNNDTALNALKFAIKKSNIKAVQLLLEHHQFKYASICLDLETFINKASKTYDVDDLATIKDIMVLIRAMRESTK